MTEIENIRCAVNRWDALTKIVVSFNSRGSPGYALGAVFLIVAPPVMAIGVAAWTGLPSAIMRALEVDQPNEHTAPTARKP